MESPDPGGGGRWRMPALFVAGLAVGSVVGLGGVLGFDAFGADASPTAMGPPHFVEEASTAGIDHTYEPSDAGRLSATVRQCSPLSSE